MAMGEGDLFTASGSNAPSNGDKTIKEEENIHVCLRLRPTSKFEASRRGRNCMEIGEDKTRITVDSPLEGEYDFSFDRVFDEDAPQAEVHEFVGRPLASKLLSGRNCALIAYGQTGSGKTHTMLGEGGHINGSFVANAGGSGNGSGRGSANGVEPQPLLTEDMPHTDVLDGSAKSEKLRELLQPPDVSSWEEKQEMKEEVAEEPKAGIIDDMSGVVPRIIKDLYQLMGESPATTEFVVRCSYVEIYLEKIIDLLSPVTRRITIVDKKRRNYNSSLPGEDNDTDSVGGAVHIEGASEACCFDENDVIALFARGNACRTVTATKMNSDSSRSHAIFLIKVEQRDCVTGITKTSQLTLVDMAGSEMAAKGKKQKGRAGGGGSALQQEAKMVNRSFSALNYVVKSLTDSRNANPNAPSEVPYRRSKFTRFLRHAFGGNCSTTLLLTASPSSYNVSETIATLRFGRRCREITNYPKIRSFLSPGDYRKKLDASEKKQKELMSFVKALAQECRSLKSEGMKGRLPKGSHNGPLWGSIDTILEESEEQETDETITEAAALQATMGNRKSFVMQSHGKSILVTGIGKAASNDNEDGVMDDLEKADLIAEVTDLHGDISQLKNQIKTLTDARDKAENLLGEMQSQVAVLRTRNENLNAEKKKNSEDLIHAKSEIQMLSQRKTELEHNLRTSQFRENEATVFLRQFRRFYRRLLRNKAAQGTGETSEITAKVPGVPDLNGLIDVDTLLLESGLIEEDELHDDTSVGTYKPSANALLKSTAAAKKAANEASALEKAGEGWDDGTSSLMSSSSLGSRAPLQTLKFGEKEGLDAISEMGDGGVSEMGDNTGMRAAGGIANQTIKEEDSAFSSQQGSASDNTPRMNAADDITSIGMRKWDMELPLNDTYTSAAKGMTANEDASAVTNSDMKSESDVDAGGDASVVSGTESLVSSVAPTSIISRSSAGGSTIAPSNLALRQKALKTPAGRLSNMREKDLERDLLQMTERCIELQIALNEEKANVDILTNKSGAISKKRLAQEAIQLRQALDRKTHDLQAIIWKMNELHLINKTYNEKMANREQHVTYLEENLVSLQNTNRSIITQQQESEKKLREELESLKEMADAMTVPLWQFGECKITEKNLCNRIVLPVRGQQYSEESEIDKSDMPASAIIEGDDESMGSAYSDESSQSEKIDPSKAVAGAVGAAALGTALYASEKPKIPTADAITQTEPFADIDEEKENKPVMVDQWTITKKTPTMSRGIVAKPEMLDEETMVEVDALEARVILVEAETMTDDFHDLEGALNMEEKGSLVEVGTMTDEFHDLESAASREVTSHEQGTMTDAVEIREERAPCVDEGTMTEETLTLTRGTMTEEAFSLDRGTMTEAASVFERGMMTETTATLEKETMTAELETAEKGTITDKEESEINTAAALAATAAIAAAVPDGSDRGRPSNQDSKNVTARNSDADDNDDIVRRDTEGSARPRSAAMDRSGSKGEEQAREMDASSDDRNMGAAAVTAAGVTAAVYQNKTDAAPEDVVQDDGKNSNLRTAPFSDVEAKEPLSSTKREAIIPNSEYKGMDDMSSIGASTNPPTREVAFQKEPPLPEGNEDIHSTGRDSRSSDDKDSASEGQLPDTMFPGGKPASYQPRRFVKKMGPKIKPGVLKESKRKSNATSSTSSSAANRRGNSSTRSGTRSRTRSRRRS